MIDIIITVFNTPIKDLERCFNSIENQTYNGWKTIIIDDGSKKEISDWIDGWCKTNDKFEVTHIENNGVSNARNIGIELSKNEYITFCDSDDAFSHNFLEDSLEIMKKYNVDIVMGGTEVIYKDKIELKTSLENKLYNNVHLIHKYMLSSFCSKDNQELNNIFAGRIYPKLYNKKALKGITFDDELIMHEDNLFISDLLNKVDTIYVSNSIWYQYYQNEYSITKVKYSEKLLNQELLFVKKLNLRKNEYEKNNLLNAFQIRVASTFLLYINRLKYSKEDLNNELNKLFSEEIFKIIYDMNLKDFKLPIKKKLLLNILKIRSNRLKTVIFKILLTI